MAELVDAPDSKSGAFGRPGSTPGLGTTSLETLRRTAFATSGWASQVTTGMKQQLRIKNHEALD